MTNKSLTVRVRFGALRPLAGRFELHGHARLCLPPRLRPAPQWSPLATCRKWQHRSDAGVPRKEV